MCHKVLLSILKPNFIFGKINKVEYNYLFTINCENTAVKQISLAAFAWPDLASVHMSIMQIELLVVMELVVVGMVGMVTIATTALHTSCLVLAIV